MTPHADADDLTRLLDQVALRDKLRERRKHLCAEIAVEEARRRDLKSRLRAEELDVIRVEGVSLEGIMASLRGRRAELVKKERDEAAAALLQHEACAKNVFTLTAQASAISGEIAKMGDLDELLALATRDRERRIAVLGGETAERLRTADDELALERAAAAEVREAVDAAKDALRGLDRVAELLAKADEWAEWDVWGGGTLVDLMKHQRLNEAREAAEQARTKMARLRSELRDVDVRVGVLEADIGRFGTLADYMMDGFLVDWMVRNRINEAQGQVAAAREQVRGLHTRLVGELARRTDRLQWMEKRRHDLLASA